jgi:signal transduction histidine kinase
MRVIKTLLESPDLLNDLTRQIPGALFIGCRSAEGHLSIPFMSQALSEMFELSQEEIRDDATPLLRRIHPDDHDGFIAMLHESASKQSPWECELRFVLPRQGLKWRHGAARPQWQENGDILWYGFTSDITARKHVEQELFETRKGLERLVEARTISLQTINERLLEKIEEGRLKQQKLLKYQHRLESLSMQLSLSEERERSRIAGELHDQVTQDLIVAKMRLGTLVTQLDNAKTMTTIEQIEMSLDKALKDIRSLTFQLRPPILANAGLVPALSWLCKEFSQDFGLDISLKEDQQPKELVYEIRAIIFQTVRELLLNVVKHAQATHVRVTIDQAGNELCITVSDDGVGIDTTSNACESGLQGGFGLFQTRQKIESLGGSFCIGMLPDKGTRVTISVPIGSFQSEQEGRV